MATTIPEHDRTETRALPRRAEVIATLALATDLALGQPLETSLRATLLAVGLGQAIGLGEDGLREVYHVSLLRSSGCTGYAHEVASWFGNDLAMVARFVTFDPTSPADFLDLLFRHVGAGQPPLRRIGLMAQSVVNGHRRRDTAAASHCEVAQLLARRLGFGEGVVNALGQIIEFWNGSGRPNRLRGEAISLAAQIVQITQDAAVFHRLAGIEGAVAMARKRSGRQYDPSIVTIFCQMAPHLFASLAVDSVWEATLAAEPGDQRRLLDAELDAALGVIADFADLKSPYMSGHSPGVSELAASAARRCGLSPAETTAIRRAALLHDLGRAGIPTAIWDKPARLTGAEWEEVRLHPYYTERLLARSPALTPLGAIAALHQERLDGSGYHRAAPASLQPPAARILAVAAAYRAMIEARPHRPALTPEAAAEELRREVHAGRLDGEMVQAVLGAAGHRGLPVRRARPSRLSEREVEVLRLVARGLSSRQVSDHLSISEKTVGHHIAHIYDKLGVSTRAAATLFAMQHDLVAEPTIFTEAFAK